MPLFNTTHGKNELIETWPIIRALAGAAPELPRLPSGPPVFLSSSQRRSWTDRYTRDYDNQWYLFASDLPSGESFKSRGITRLLIVAADPLAQDLQDALVGRPELEVLVVDPSSSTPEPLQLTRGPVRRTLAGFGRALSRNVDGTFGHPISHG